MRIALFSRFLKKEQQQLVQEVFDALARRPEWELYIYQEYYDSFMGRIKINNSFYCFQTHEDFRAAELDCCITLGGDGTILEAVTYVRDTGVPIWGLNMGRLGFLAMIEKHRIEESLQAFEQGALVEDKRVLLQLESSSPLFGSANFALNDFAILKRDTSSMVIIHTYVNGEFLNSYWADGVIVASPTGSTGYSLSCGGPIIFPRSGNFIITPVAPHNLNVRPIVLSDDVVISFEVEGRAEHFLCTLDSRYRAIQASCQLAIRKCDFQTTLLRPDDRNFLYMIRKKLHWGTDSRNY